MMGTQIRRRRATSEWLWWWCRGGKIVKECIRNVMSVVLSLLYPKWRNAMAKHCHLQGSENPVE